MKRSSTYKHPLLVIMILLSVVIIGSAMFPNLALTQEHGGGVNTIPDTALTTNSAETPRVEQSIPSETEPTEPETGKPMDIGSILYALIIVLLTAKLGGDLMERAKQPSVLGELVFGVIIGNLFLLGYHGLDFLKHSYVIEVLAEIGVILLLFEVGLESSLKEMLSVGVLSLAVAVLGILAPFALGWAVSAYFFPYESIYVHIFAGATLTATSVGITARVLKDINRIQTTESKIILGAAVIDDILGLVVLSVVVGIIDAHNIGGTLSAFSTLWIIIKAVLFVAGALLLGTLFATPLFKAVSRLRAQGILITFALIFCFLYAFVANQLGLAPIVGAFAAGVVLSDINFKDIFTRERHGLEELLNPLSAFLVPIFFVYMGLKVDLTTFLQGHVLIFALVLTLAAIVGKQICSVIGFFKKDINAWIIGIGMIPRGEVGLIFAGIGASLVVDGDRVISPDVYSAVIIMVVITTLMTPPILKQLFSKRP